MMLPSDTRKQWCPRNGHDRGSAHPASNREDGGSVAIAHQKKRPQREEHHRNGDAQIDDLRHDSALLLVPAGISPGPSATDLHSRQYGQEKACDRRGQQYRSAAHLRPQPTLSTKRPRARERPTDRRASLFGAGVGGIRFSSCSLEGSPGPPRRYWPLSGCQHAGLGTQQRPTGSSCPDWRTRPTPGPRP